MGCLAHWIMMRDSFCKYSLLQIFFKFFLRDNVLLVLITKTCYQLLDVKAAGPFLEGARVTAILESRTYYYA